MRNLLAIVLLYLLPAVAAGQEEVYFDIEYEHAVLQPGQAQTITVSASFAPPLGGHAIWDTHGGTGQVGQVIALNDAYFNLLNVFNAHTGVYSNPATNMSIYSFPGIPSGGGVSMISVGQFDSIEIGNPVWLWRATWTPIDYNPRVVTLRTEAIVPIDIFLYVGLAFEVPDAWTTFDDEASFQIVPAPGVTVTLLAGALLAARRRRPVV